MPNTPMQVCEGATVYAAGSSVTAGDLDKVHLLLSSLGYAQLVAEPMINAVGPVTGCGPAFVYTIIEALADASVKLGVPRAMAIRCAAQTVLGAAKTVLQTGRHPAELRDEVINLLRLPHTNTTFDVVFKNNIDQRYAHREDQRLWGFMNWNEAA